MSIVLLYPQSRIRKASVRFPVAVTIFLRGRFHGLRGVRVDTNTCLSFDVREEERRRIYEPQNRGGKKRNRTGLLNPIRST